MEKRTDLTYLEAITELQKLAKAMESGRISAKFMPQATRIIVGLANFLLHYLHDREAHLRALLSEIKAESGKKQRTALSSSGRSSKKIAHDVITIEDIESLSDEIEYLPLFNKEKRKYKRMPILLDVNLTHNEYKFQGQMMDISYGGFFVETLEVFPPNTNLNFEFNLLRHKITGEGVVRSAVDYLGMGIEFKELSPSDQDVVLQYVFDEKKYL